MNNAQAFYLKYRPQTLTEIIGQDKVKEILFLSFRQNRLSHAYILVGPKGSGKTSTARILAKMINCENNKDEVPCNKCTTCLTITDGSNLDLIEIDAASNRGIEDIRALREKIKLAPTSSKKKVYIIDEVHMLTTEAFNALLKTLEEPPQHALFILATTDATKVPNTILSRVQRLDFSLATLDQLKQALEKIIKLEKIDISKEALDYLISRADGSFRDGVKLLDQLNKGAKIETKDILENFKSLDFEIILNLIEDFTDHKTSKSLMEVKKLVDQGVDIKEMVLSLVDVFRKIMFIKNDLGEQLVKEHYTLDKYEKLLNVAKKFENKTILNNLNILQNALEKLKFASIPQLPLELAVIEISGSEESFNQMRSENQEISEPVIKKREEKEFDDTPISEIPIPETPTLSAGRQVASDLSGTPSSSDSADILKLKEKWTYVCETIRAYNFSLEALLRSGRIVECTQTLVVMEVPYSFHQRILEAPKNRDLLEGVLSEVLGRQIKVSCILGTRPIRKEEIANVEVAEDDEIIRVAAEIFNSDSVN